MVIVTHNRQLEDVADRILWLEDGRLRDREDEGRLWTRDPVCNMQVDQWTATFFAEYQGPRHFFCFQRCQERFLERPEAYGAIVQPVIGPR